MTDDKIKDFFFGGDLSPIKNWDYAAHRLFRAIMDDLGEAEARRIFLNQGAWSTPRKLADIKNDGVLIQYDMMKPEPNVQQLAFRLASENKKLPKKEQRGAGSTNAFALERLRAHCTGRRRFRAYN
jgi:hypothetical protein